MNSTPTRFLYDGDQLLAETDGAGSVQATYLYGPGIDEPLRMIRGATASYYHADGLGSVIALSNASGTLAESTPYDVFGQPTATSTLGNPFLFTGREYDPETGLYYYRARYYEPQMGRFLSRDPLGYLPDQNLYRYVQNNPTTWVDPLGLDKRSPDGSGADDGSPKDADQKAPSWWDWWMNESAVPGPFGQPRSEWGPNGPTSWGDPVKYTEAAGGPWKWGERAALALATGATAFAVAGGTGAFSRGGWLNNNDYFRLGWSWRGTRATGQNVFRLALGSRRLPFWRHIDFWPW